MYNGKPVIGLTSSFEAIPEADKIFLPHAYFDAVRHFGGIPMMIPVHATEEEQLFLLNQCDGLILTGGNDIAPKHYGESIWNDTVEPAPERDAAEWKICGMALERNIPILGICRGFQLLNVFFGGTLHQLIPGHNDIPEGHRIHIAPDSFLSSVYGFSTSVNSYHRQCVDEVAPGFTVTARAEDGTVEAIEKGNILGVQWQPEVMLDSPFFDAFLKTYF